MKNQRRLTTKPFMQAPLTGTRIKNDYKPFVNYMLGIIVSAYKEFKYRVKLVTDPNLSKADRIREIIKNHIGTITKSELIEMNPDISDTTVQRSLADLFKEKQN